MTKYVIEVPEPELVVQVRLEQRDGDVAVVVASGPTHQTIAVVLSGGALYLPWLSPDTAPALGLQRSEDGSIKAAA